MKKVTLVLVVIAACAGCNSAQVFKGTSVEYGPDGKVLRRVESESVSKTEMSDKKLTLKYLQL